MSKENKSTFASFLKGPAGVQLMNHCGAMEKSLLLKAIGAKTSDEKANYVSQIEGTLLIRDYIIRQATGE